MLKMRVHNLIIVDESGSMTVIHRQAFTGMNETLQTIRQMQEKYHEQEQYVTQRSGSPNERPCPRSLPPQRKHTTLRCHRNGHF